MLTMTDLGLEAVAMKFIKTVAAMNAKLGGGSRAHRTCSPALEAASSYRSAWMQARVRCHHGQRRREPVINVQRSGSMSFRSSDGRALESARKFHGGGHKNAAGGRLTTSAVTSLKQAVTQVEPIPNPPKADLSKSPLATLQNSRRSWEHRNVSAIPRHDAPATT